MVYSHVGVLKRSECFVYLCSYFKKYTAIQWIILSCKLEIAEVILEPVWFFTFFFCLFTFLSTCKISREMKRGEDHAEFGKSCWKWTCWSYISKYSRVFYVYYLLWKRGEGKWSSGLIMSTPWTLRWIHVESSGPWFRGTQACEAESRMRNLKADGC